MPDTRTVSQRTSWKRALYVVYFNLALFCVLLVGIEVAGQVGFFLVHGYPIVESDWHTGLYENLFEPHPFLVGRPRANAIVSAEGKTVSTTDLHTRWTGAPREAETRIRVAVLGGSTTFGTRVDDVDSWPAQLQQQLGDDYAVYNFGVPGYASSEAIIQMALVVPEVRPHIVVYYLGWNDIRNYHDARLGPDYYSHGLQQYSALALPIHPREGAFARMARVSAVFKLAGRLSRAIQNVPDVVATPVAEPDTFVDRIYLRNLRTLNSLAAAAGAHAVFIPQILNDEHFRGRAGSRFWSPRIVDDAMPRLMARLNSVMDDVCPSGGKSCSVLDIAHAHTWSPAHFVDDGHLNGEGGRQFAGVLADHIRTLRNTLVARMLVPGGPQCGHAPGSASLGDCSSASR
jgi:lysophospholipase L1-like esterase